MEITDEMITFYVEGTATTEEQQQVRNYLSLHPEEQERILCLMDLDRDDYLNEQDCNTADINMSNEYSFSDIAMSAAAFAPKQQLSLALDKKNFYKKSISLTQRLNKLWNELEK